MLYSIKILSDGNTVLTLNGGYGVNSPLYFVDVSNPSDIFVSAEIAFPIDTYILDMAIGSLNAYFSDYDGNLWTLDIASKTVTGSVHLIGGITSMFFSSDQSLIYGRNLESAAFYVFNIAENTITASIPFSDSLIYVMLDSLDTNYAIGNNESDYLYKIDLTTFAISTLAVRNYDQFDISTITGKIYTGDHVTDNIWIIDESTFTVTGSIPTHAPITAVGVINYGTLLFAFDKDDYIEIIDTTVGSVIYTYTEGVTPTAYSFNILVTNTSVAFPSADYYVEAIALEDTNIENAAPLNGVGAGLSLNSGSVGLTSYQIYQELTSSFIQPTDQENVFPSDAKV